MIGQNHIQGTGLRGTELFLLGTRQLRAGQLDDAKRSFRENEEKLGTGGHTQALLLQAEKRLTEGRVAEALAAYTTALDQNPSRPEVHLGLARIAIASGLMEEAGLHAATATALAPELGLGWTLLGLVKEAQGDAAGALTLMLKGATHAPDTALCHLNLGRLLTVQGRAAEALGPLTTATALEPRSAAAFGWLGLAQQQAGQAIPALRALEQAKELEPKNPARWVVLADALLQLRQFGAAAGLMDRGLAQLGDDAGLLERAATAAAMSSDAPRAISYLERELAVRQEREDAWLTLASLSITTGALDRAEQALQTLVTRNPKHAEAWFLLGNLYGAATREKEAEAAYRHAIELAPSDFRPLMNLATLFIESTSATSYAQAVPLLERAMELEPEGEWRAAYNLALAFTRLGKTDQAQELARRIQREAPPTNPMGVEAKRLESNILESKRS